MPDNSTIIEELAKTLNSGYEQQQESLKELIGKLVDAQDRGASQGVINLLSNEIDKLSQSIELQNSTANDFYNEMVKISGGRTDLSEEMLKDAYSFRSDYVKLTQEIRKLISEHELEEKKKDVYGNPAYDKEKLKANEEEQKRVRDDVSKLLNGLTTKYGRDSGVVKSAQDFIMNLKERREFEEKLNELENSRLLTLIAETKQQKLYNEQLQEAQKKWTVIKNVANDVFSQVKDGANLWLKYNAQAISDAKRLGMTNKEEALGYMEALMENSKTLARNFGMTADQAMKMQEAYVKVTGRAALLTESQMEDIAAASKLMGEETVQSAISMMDSMGTTSQTTTELLDKNFARAVNTGLDTVQASEAFVKNMSLANKLNFRNGVDGISKMTILSEKVKMNLQEVASVADKFSTIEGAIEGSARLQMLGGAGALYGSNPMQMMYEALSDPEALYERMVKMFGGQAVFDRRTGESKIDPIQLQIIREQAKALGMNPDEAVQSAKRQAKNNAIESDLMAYNPSLFRRLDDEKKSAIMNKAEYNKEKGTWEIKYLNKEDKEQVVSIQNITENDLAEITKDNIEPVEDIRKNVRKIASELIGTGERMDSMKDQFKTGIAQLISGPMKWFDGLLTDLNNGNIWKFLTDAAFGTATGIVGVTGLKYGYGKVKAKIGKWAVNKLTRSGGNAIEPAGGLKQVPKQNIVSDTKTLGKPSNVIKEGGKTGRISGRLGKLGKISKFGTVMAVAGGVVEGYTQWQKADERFDRQAAVFGQANSANNYTIRGRQYGAREVAAMRTNAENRRAEGRAGAVGAGVGTATGAMVGAAIGSAIPVLGTIVGGLVGGLIGGFFGGKQGKKIGRKFANTKDDDTINAHLNEINEGDEEENFRKIVLPVESIDYNVSLIANQLGILSAKPARGNIYLEAESAGELEVEGTPLQASTVNQVDTYTVNNSQVYRPSGSLTLNVNGSIDLNMKGMDVGKLTAADFKKMFDSNPELQRQIAEVVTNRQVRNGNANRFNNESSDNRRSTGSNMYIA